MMMRGGQRRLCYTRFAIRLFFFSFHLSCLQDPYGRAPYFRPSPIKRNRLISICFFFSCISIIIERKSRFFTFEKRKKKNVDPHHRLCLLCSTKIKVIVVLKEKRLKKKLVICEYSCYIDNVASPSYIFTVFYIPFFFSHDLLYQI